MWLEIRSLFVNLSLYPKKGGGKRKNLTASHFTKRALEKDGFTPASAEIGMEPTSTVKLEGRAAESMLRLTDALEDLDDVQHVYANFDISDEEMARIAG